MCTVVYLGDLSLLSKNRDKERPTEEEFVRGSGHLAVRTKGADYFSLAVNRHGVAFVSTAVNSPDWTRAVEEGRADDAKSIMEAERKGQTSPTKAISEHISDARNIDDLLAILERPGPSRMGYNVVMADREKAAVLEVFGTQTHRRWLEKRDVITNHFTDLDHGAKTHDDYPSSFERLAYGRHHLDQLSSFADLADVVHPSDDPERAEEIWRKDVFRTISSTVIDLSAPSIFFTPSLDDEFHGHYLAEA
jgi:hypothetical protein